MNMDMPHQMELREVYADGSQDWHCPVCGRRFILHWPPNYHREVLNEGDLEAVHTAGTGGMQMGSAELESEAVFQTAPVDDENFDGIAIDLDDPSLSAFARFFDEVEQ